MRVEHEHNSEWDIMLGLRICQALSVEHGRLTQTDKYGRQVTFVISSQNVIQLVVRAGQA